MRQSVILTPEAEAELIEAKQWYDARDPRASQRFISHLRLAIARIRALPHSFPTAHLDVHCCVLRHFPYNIYFRIQPNRIKVIGVVHQRRDPADWQDRQ